MKTNSFLIFFLYLSHLLFAQIATQVDGKEPVVGVEQLSYFTDPSRNLSIESVVKSSFQSNFIAHDNTQILNFGITNAAVWLRLPIQISTSKSYYIQIDNPTLDSVFFYYPNRDGGYHSKLTGKKLPPSTEDILSTHCIIQIPPPTDDRLHYYYLRLTTTRYINVDIRIIEEKSILSSLSKRYALELIFFGIIILAFFYNLFAFFVIKEHTYLYYVLYAFWIGLHILNVRGYLLFFLTDYKEFISKYTYLTGTLYTPCVTLFVISYLQLKKYSPSLYKIAITLIGISTAQLLAIAFAINVPILKFGVYLIFINNVFWVFSAIIIYRKGYAPAIYAFYGWGSFFIFNTLGIISYYKIIPYYSFSQYFTPLGVVLETIIISLALANRVSILQKEKEVIEKQRSYELQLMLDRLTTQNQDLKQFSYIVSHNIRAPIARILGLVNIFDKEKIADQYNHQILGYLGDAANDLDTVIKDLTKIISVRNDLNKNKETILLSEVIDLEMLALKDEILQAEAIIHKDFATTATLFSVKSYVQSIFHNLLSNAIKYRSNQRKLEVSIKLILSANYVCIAVQDNGIGIDLTTIDPYKIFGLYQRMHDHVEGKGLGLYLVKTQIESLGGKVEVESKLNAGSIFRVYFPIKTDLL